MASTTFIGSLPVQYGLELPQSNSSAVMFRFKENGTGIDLSAFSFVAQMRRKPSYTQAWDFTVDATNAATGELIVTMPADTTRPGVGHWDLIAHNGASVTTLVEGPIVLPASVSRTP